MGILAKNSSFPGGCSCDEHIKWCAGVDRVEVIKDLLVIPVAVDQSLSEHPYLRKRAVVDVVKELVPLLVLVQFSPVLGEGGNSAFESRHETDIEPVVVCGHGNHL